MAHQQWYENDGEPNCLEIAALVKFADYEDISKSRKSFFCSFEECFP
jgi:hypothetical protein